MSSKQEHEEYLMDKRSEAQWNRAYAEESDRKEKGVKNLLELAGKAADEDEMYVQAMKESEALDEAYGEAFSCLSEGNSFDEDVQRLVNVSRKVMSQLPTNHPLYVKLADAIANVEEHFLEETEDPRAMGWVDDKGRCVQTISIIRSS